MIKREYLASGKVLKVLIDRFHDNQTQHNAFAVMHCLRDSYVFIPCTVQMSERDQAKFLNAKVGEEISTEDDVRYVPDTLNNGVDNFLPVFSSNEEMGEYGDDFSKVEHHFLDVLSLAKRNENVKGIVVNAFTQHFIVEKDLFEFIANLPTNVEE